jgi:iron complex outermembrane receptor protein
MRAAAALVILLAAAPARADEEPYLEVEVQADQVPVEARSDPTPAVYVLRGPALHRPGAGLADALEGVPGVQTQRAGGAADLATASLRGATSGQTPVYLAGVRLNDELTGTVDLSTLPTWLFDRVEVYRGNAPAGVLELGIGGAILVEPIVPRRTMGAAAFGLGSFGEREVRGLVGLGGEAAGALVGVRHARGVGDYAFLDDGGTRFDDGDDVERRRRNADHEEIDAWAIARARHGDVRLDVVLEVYGRDAGAPGLQLRGAERSRAAIRRALGGIELSAPCPARAPCFLSLGVDALVTRYRLDDPLGEIGLAPQVETAGERLGQHLRFGFLPIEELTLTLGASSSRQQLRLGAGGATAQHAIRQLWRGEIGAHARPHETVDLVALGAVDCHGTTASPGPDSDGCGVLEPVGRFGTRWRPLEPLSVFANVGRYVRVPTLGELHGASATVLGNAELAAERGVTVDAGVTAAAAEEGLAVYAQVAGFVRLVDDLVAYRRASLGAVRPYNVGSARVLGIEGAAGATVIELVRAGITVTALDPRDTSDDRGTANDLLPLAARLEIGPELEVSSPPWPEAGVTAARAGARFRWRGERLADPAGLIVLDAESQLDLDAALAFAAGIVVSGRVANVLDQRTFDLVGYPRPGRSAHLLVEASW